MQRNLKNVHILISFGMYTANPIPVLEGAAAQRFQEQAMKNDSRRGSEDYSEAFRALQTILHRSAQ